MIVASSSDHAGYLHNFKAMWALGVHGTQCNNAGSRLCRQVKGQASCTRAMGIAPLEQQHLPQEASNKKVLAKPCNL
jgi:hypothetical protein